MITLPVLLLGVCLQTYLLTGFSVGLLRKETAGGGTACLRPPSRLSYLPFRMIDSLRARRGLLRVDAGIIRTPEIPATVTCGGPDMRTLFFTARTSLYTLRAKTPGLVHPRCR